jgi:hypothetical protein
LQVKYHISSAIQVGLLPEGFILNKDYNWEENISCWRGPWVDKVLRQDCVIGTDMRERDAAVAKARRDELIQNTMVNFGFALDSEPNVAQVQNLVDAQSFDAFVQASFTNRSDDDKNLLKTLLGSWELTKKEAAAAKKRKRSRDSVAAVNSLDLESLQVAANQNAAQQLAADEALLLASLEKCFKRGEESLKQFQLVVTRGQKCESLLGQAFSANSKKVIELLLNNVKNGDEFWHAANEEGRKVRRMDLANNFAAQEARASFDERWAAIEARKYQIDVDGGIQHAANLALSFEDFPDYDRSNIAIFSALFSV